MKKFIALAAFVVFGTVTGFSQFKFGAGANMIFDGSFFGVGARAHNTFTEDFAGQASFHYYFESGFTVWTLDLDVHYSGFELGDVESFSLTPFAGINIFNVSADTGLGFGVSASSTNLNLGLNGTMPLTESLDLYIEPKIIIGNGGSFAIAAGVYF